jgi:nucleoside phosphorylase
MTAGVDDEQVVEELSRVFYDADQAKLLATRAGLPRPLLPAFGTSLVFWSSVAQMARDGAILGGLGRIMDEAKTMYPGNPVFAQYRSASPSPPSAPRTKGTHSRSGIDYLVVTAKDLEAAAVLDFLVATDEELDVDGTLVEIARLGDLRVGVMTTGPGNIAAATMTAAVATTHKPHAVVFIGIAGGIKDVSLGDVVVATKVYGYESGKETDDGFETRPEVARSDHALVQRAHRISRDGAWRHRAGLGPTDSSRSFVAPIAAGEKVIASRRSEVVSRLRRTYGDALAVEMEGSGALDAAYRVKTPGLVVRGISDLLDDKAAADASGSQPRAAKNAAAFALEVILSYHRALESRNP